MILRRLMDVVAFNLRRIFALTVLVTGLMPAQASYCDSRKIVIVADEWCPYNCEAASRFQGFMIDTMREIFAKSGYQIEYKNLSWSEALISVASGKYDAVVGASVEEAQKLAIAVEPLGENKTCFYTRSDDPFKYRGFEQLRKRRLGVTYGYLYGAAIDDYVAMNRDNSELVQIVSGDKPLLRNLQRLNGRRVDTIVENNAVMNYSIQKYLISGIREAGCEQPTTLHIAFSPKRADSSDLVKLTNQGIKDLRKSGRLSDILSRYSIIDWK